MSFRVFFFVSTTVDFLEVVVFITFYIIEKFQAENKPGYVLKFNKKKKLVSTKTNENKELKNRKNCMFLLDFSNKSH